MNHQIKETFQCLQFCVLSATKERDSEKNEFSIWKLQKGRALTWKQNKTKQRTQPLRLRTYSNEQDPRVERRGVTDMTNIRPSTASVPSQ